MAGKKQTKTSEERLITKRLGFLYTFLKGNFLTLKGIPREVIPFSTLNTNLDKDDMRLRQLFAIFDYYQYYFLIYLEPKDPYLAKKYRDKCVNVNGGMVNPEGGERLGFLKDFVNINNYHYKDITDRMGMTQSAIYAWFNKDDMMLSKLYKISKVFDVNLHFIIKPKMEEKESEVPTVIVDVHVIKPCSIGEDMTHTVWEKDE